MAKFKVGDIALFEMLIAVTVIIVLVMATVSMMMGQQSTLDSISFAMSKQNFSKNVAIINSQWLLEGRPVELVFNVFDANKENNKQAVVTQSTVLTMSKAGWPSLTDKQQPNYCKVLWATISNLSIDEDVIKNLIVKKEQKNDDIVCQFCDADINNACLTYSMRYGY